MGALRRVAPIPSAGPLSKPSRGAAPATCGAVARELPSTGRFVGANQKLAAPPISKYTKVIYNGVVTEMEVTPVAGGKVPPNSSRPMLKRPRVVETATCGTMAPEKKPARRARDDEQFSMPNPKRAKVTRDGGVEASVVVPAMGTLRKRMAAELDALHALVRKAELLSSGKSARSTAAKQQSEAPVEPSIKTPPVKRRKVSPSAPAKIAELESPEDKNEFVEICGGVSPVAIKQASPLVSFEKAVETGDSDSKAPPEDDVEFKVGEKAGALAGASSNSPSSSSNSGSSSSSDSEDSDSDSGSSSSSGSDSDSDSGSSSSSDSDSDSDSDEAGDIPVPEAVLPEENGTSVQPAPQPTLKVVRSMEPEKLSKTVLIAKAKIRKQLLEMERAVLPDESIHPRELKDLCIAEYGRPGIMRLLGLFLKADA